MIFQTWFFFLQLFFIVRKVQTLGLCYLATNPTNPFIIILSRIQLTWQRINIISKSCKRFMNVFFHEPTLISCEDSWQKKYINPFSSARIYYKTFYECFLVSSCSDLWKFMKSAEGKNKKFAPHKCVVTCDTPFKKHWSTLMVWVYNEIHKDP